MDFSKISLHQFQDHFSSEEACVEFVYRTKWPKGFICPRCKHMHAYVTGTRRLPLYECSYCRHQSSLIAGTLMEGSRTELRKWLMALFLLSRTDKGTTAVELSNLIHVTYKTAWSMLHKIRLTLHTVGQQKLLTGAIRINSAVYGRPFNPSVNKHPQEHLLLIGASLNEHGESTCLKIKFVLPENPREKHISRAETMVFCQQHVEPQTNSPDIVTGFYSPKSKRPLLAFATQMSKWMNETFHGLGPKHLQKYIDEFCYRLNLSIQHVPIFENLSYLCFSASAFHDFHVR